MRRDEEIVPNLLVRYLDQRAGVDCRCQKPGLKRHGSIALTTDHLPFLRIVMVSGSITRSATHKRDVDDAALSAFHHETHILSGAVELKQMQLHRRQCGCVQMKILTGLKDVDGDVALLWPGDAIFLDDGSCNDKSQKTGYRPHGPDLSPSVGARGRGWPDLNVLMAHLEPSIPGKSYRPVHAVATARP